ncbi:MAG: spermidine synthase [bacterium]
MSEGAGDRQGASGPALAERPWRLAFAVGLISAAVLAFEVSLMRMMLVASWHHFTFLVISIALLGFGASGTALSLARAWLLPRGDALFTALSVAAFVSMPIAALLAQHVPVEARLAPAELWLQIGNWVLLFAVLAVPFLLGAAAIGLGLMLAGDRAGVVYAGNLVGSAVGALGANALMWFVAPAWLPVAASAAALGAIPAGRWRSLRARVGVSVVAVAAVALALAVEPPHVPLDPFKYRAHVARLEQEGAARRLAVRYSPRSTVELFRGDAFHHMPFLSPDAPPPRLHVLTADGHWAGSMLRPNRGGQGRIADQTLMGVGYDLLGRRPRVALLGEVGGTNAWLAARHGADAIHVVQPDPRVVELWRQRPDGAARRFIDLPAVRVHVAEPRQFVDRATTQFDLVHVVSLESLAAGSGGVAGLAENHLVTVEGMAACIECLAPDGLLMVCRGIQTPPRDNLKLLATLVRALRRMGVERPGEHVVIVRDYLGVCTLVRRTPWTDGEVERVRAACRRRNLTPVWFRGIRPDELNRPDALPGPAGNRGDWFHHGARRLFSDEAAAFIDDWMFDIRPPTDDRPFFLDFCRLGSIHKLREAFGRLWLTRAELAFLFVLAAVVLVAAAGAALTILPLAVVRPLRTAPRLGPVVVYFGAIGLGYMALEIVALSRLTRLVGDPVQAGALTIAGFLMFSGLGSLTAQRLPAAARGLTWLIGGIVLAAAGSLLLLELAPSWASGWAGAWRAALGVALIVPPAYLMGFAMPGGLRRLAAGGPAAVPWAWAVNGFASVLAAPLATLVAMAWGFRVAAAGALLAYLAAALCWRRLPGAA